MALPLVWLLCARFLNWFCRHYSFVFFILFFFFMFLHSYNRSVQRAKQQQQQPTFASQASKAALQPRITCCSLAYLAWDACPIQIYTQSFIRSFTRSLAHLRSIHFSDSQQLNDLTASTFCNSSFHFHLVFGYGQVNSGFSHVPCGRNIFMANCALQRFY